MEILDKVAEIRTRCDIAEDSLRYADYSPEIMEIYRKLVETRRNLDIAEEIMVKLGKSA
jgi:hypothetical protein